MIEDHNAQQDRLRRVHDLFQAAISLEEHERNAFLKRSCQDDPVTICEVKRLLDHYHPEDSFLEPACGNWDGDPAANPVHAGCIFGAYRLTQPIKSGGMGSVWLGERADGAFEQRVAVKLVCCALVSAQMRFRIEVERQLTAATAEIEQESNRAREELRAEVSAVALAGAQKILDREIDPSTHEDILGRLAQDL